MVAPRPWLLGKERGWLTGDKLPEEGLPEAAAYTSEEAMAAVMLALPTGTSLGRSYHGHCPDRVFTV